MQTIRLLTTLLLLLLVIIIGEKSLFNPKSSLPIITPTSSPTLTPTPTATLTPTAPKKSSTDSQSSKSQEQGSINEYLYPNAKVINISSQRATLESTDSEDAVSNWYKEKINDKVMRATAFVQTSTNGNVVNKLAGAKENYKVAVEIKKVPNQSITKITVVVSSQ